MAKRQHIHLSVQEAVVGWGAASDVEAAAKHLSQSRSRLDASLARQLVGEVAEVTIECVIGLLADAADSSGGAALTRVADAELNPLQLGHLSAWISDLPRTAEALGLSLENWSHELGAAANRILSASALNDDRDLPQNPTLLGLARRVIPGPSAGPGFISQLAARVDKPR